MERFTVPSTTDGQEGKESRTLSGSKEVNLLARPTLGSFGIREAGCTGGVQMTDGERGHLAYLLRLWRTGRGESARWRASLQDVQSGQRMGFACLDDAVEFLKQRMDERNTGSDDGADVACARQGPS